MKINKSFCYSCFAFVFNSFSLFTQINSEAFKIKNSNIKNIEYKTGNSEIIQLNFDQKGRITKLALIKNENEEEFFFDSLGNNTSFSSFINDRDRNRKYIEEWMEAKYKENELMSMYHIILNTDSCLYTKSINGNKKIETFGCLFGRKRIRITDATEDKKVFIHECEINDKKDSLWHFSYLLSFDNRREIDSVSMFDIDLKTPVSIYSKCKEKNQLIECNCPYGLKKYSTFQFPSLAKELAYELIMLGETESVYLFSPLGMIKKTKKKQGKDAVIIRYF